MDPAAPDPSNLRSGRFDAIDWVSSTGSTNEDLRARAVAEPTVARVLIADDQTAGRGRRDRTWTMRPKGGLPISFYVPWSATSTLPALATALGVAAVDAVRELSGSAAPTLKWPNDLVVDAADGSYAKLGGMLSEVVVRDGATIGAVCGLGVNVTWPDAAAIAESGGALAGACALAGIAEHPVDRVELARAIIVNFDAELGRLEALGARAIHDRYRDRCSTIGRRVRIDTGRDSVEGVATDIDSDGALVVAVDGHPTVFAAGDVVHLRPVGGE